MSYLFTPKEIESLNRSGLQCLEDIKDIVVITCPSGEIIRLNQTVEYGNIGRDLFELAEIKQRAEEKRELFQNGIETSKGTAVESFVEVSNTYKIRLIDYILKGEKK